MPIIDPQYKRISDKTIDPIHEDKLAQEVDNRYFNSQEKDLEYEGENKNRKRLQENINRAKRDFRD